MKIKYLKVNGFGKLSQKEMQLDDGINVIYGKNETGKSTLLKFISAMFYGASKNKNGKAISDFDKYKPWKTEEFSGKMEYELDNGQTFEVYREFKKKNPLIYNSEKQDISKTFKEDKSSGISFFMEQTGIDEQTYYNTAIIEQSGVALKAADQTNIIQKIGNMVSTGDDNVSYKKSLAQISKMQLEKVGTERSIQKPINIVNKKIAELTEEKEKIEKLRDENLSKKQEIEELKKELKNEEQKLDFLSDVKKLKENARIKNAEINVIKDMVLKDKKRIDKLDEEMEDIIQFYEDPENYSNFSGDILNPLKENARDKISKIDTTAHRVQHLVVMIIFLIIGIVLMVSNISKIAGIASIAIGIISYAIYFIRCRKEKNKLAKDKQIEVDDVNDEKEIIEENYKNRQAEIIEKDENLKKEISIEKNRIKTQYANKLDIDFLERNLDKSYERLDKDVENIQKNITKLKVEIGNREVNDRLLNEKLEKLPTIQEELEKAEEEKQSLVSLNNSYNIAKECLEIAYEEVKKNISPKFTSNLCSIISEISNNKYSKIKFNDENGLIVELDNGNYVPAERLSVGTIDQMYLSLRLSALKEIASETMPIILDEAFAYFDDDRLKNILKYLNENYQNCQVLIFTCSNREKEKLNELNIQYNTITLES